MASCLRVIFEQNDTSSIGLEVEFLCQMWYTNNIFKFWNEHRQSWQNWRFYHWTDSLNSFNILQLQYFKCKDIVKMTPKGVDLKMFII